MKNLPHLRFLCTTAIVTAVSTAIGTYALPSFAGTIIVENPYERFPNRSSETTTTIINRPSNIPSPGSTTSLAALPNGVYRAISPVEICGTSQFQTQSERTFFTFRKLGNRVTGNLEFPDRRLLACGSGTVEDNLIVGDAVTSPESSFVFGRDALVPIPSLQLGRFVAGNRYTNSVLDLNGFRRIETGTATPPSACFY